MNNPPLAAATCSLSDALVNTGQAFPCPVHKRHKLRTPTTAQSIEAIIYAHSIPGSTQKRSWRRDLTCEILDFLRAKKLNFTGPEDVEGAD